MQMSLKAVLLFPFVHHEWLKKFECVDALLILRL